MPTARLQPLLWKAGCGLALMLLGLLVVLRAGPDSTGALFGLFSHLLGLLCLASALWPWLFSTPKNPPGTLYNIKPLTRKPPPFRFRSRFPRFVLSLLLLIVPGYILFSAGADLGGLILLASGGHATAQVIGRDIVPPDAPTGYVNYAFRAEGVAVVGRFAVPHSDYPIYWTGYPLQVTYRKSEPRDFYLGTVGAGTVARRGLFWLLALLNGLVFFGVPLRWLNRPTPQAAE